MLRSISDLWMTSAVPHAHRPPKPVGFEPFEVGAARQRDQFSLRVPSYGVGKVTQGWFRNRDPRQARYLTWSSLRWVIRNRAYTPWYLLRYWRFFLFPLRHPPIITTRFVFLRQKIELDARQGFGRGVVGR